MLKISREIFDKIVALLEKEYPYEGCGILIGKEDNNKRVVLEIYPTQNINKERKNDRFNIDPKDYLVAETYADKNNLSIVGIYHSHPDHPAFPSKTDLENAFPFLSYIIFSIEKGRFKDVNSFELINESFQREEIIIE